MAISTKTIWVSRQRIGFRVNRLDTDFFVVEDFHGTGKWQRVDSYADALRLVKSLYGVSANYTTDRSKVALVTLRAA